MRRLAAVLLLLLPACASTPPKVTLASPERAYRQRDYPQELKRWTRFASILRELDTTLRVHATLRSARFDAALLAKRKALFKLPPKRVADKAAERAKSRADEFTFVVVAATHDSAWNDFGQRNSHWRLALVNDSGQQVEPSKVVLRKRPNATDLAFFPHLEMFYKLYDVRFPRRGAEGQELLTPSTRRLTLRIDGALGSAELVWRLR